jgi:hypothetical protein
VPISVNDSVKDAAAKTFKVTRAGEGMEALPVLVVVEPPHAASNMLKLRNNKNKRKLRFMGPPRGYLMYTPISISEYSYIEYKENAIQCQWEDTEQQD